MGARERSWVAWLPAVVRWGGPVLSPGGCRWPRGAAGFLFEGLATGGFRVRAWAGRIASAGAVRFPFTRVLARWPCPRLPITSAAAWCPVVSGCCSRSRGEPVHSCPAAGIGRVDHDDRRPAFAVICVRRSLNRAVGMPATSRRNPRPRLPREGRVPVRSRPSARPCSKSRSSITTARAPCAFAVAMRRVTAARSRPSRVAAGSPARSRVILSFRVSRCCDLRRPVVDSVADGTLAA